MLPAWRGKGMGTALTIAAGELAATYSDLTWLHCTPRSRDLYKRLGYDHIGHALLVVDPDEPAVALTSGEVCAAVPLPGPPAGRNE